jgi:ribonuclease HI
MAWYGRVPEERAPGDTRHGALLAEGYAALAGLHLARKYDPTARVIIVKTDCKGLISLVNRGMHGDPEVAELQRRLRNKVRQWDDVRWSWVRGHKAGTEPKAYLNRKADEFARRGRLQDRPVVREFIQRMDEGGEC